MIISINREDNTPLTEQIIQGLQTLIDHRELRVAHRMPSIRQFSEQHQVSRFTTVQAYDRLVAMGYLESRPGSGFYVSSRQILPGQQEARIQLDNAVDVLWLLRHALNQPGNQPGSQNGYQAGQMAQYRLMPGAGWLPGEWMDVAGIQKGLRQLAQSQSDSLIAYGHPMGYQPLRKQLQQRLVGYGIQLNSDQILLTGGGTQSLDLIARYLIRSGDTVLVDDPGYFILYGTLKSYGAKIVGVPWTEHGPDVAVLESLIKKHKPRLFFTNSVLHNPSGASMHQSVAHKVLQLVENADMMIVEDDVFADFAMPSVTRLATLDQLNRVIYISSFSKTISASMRVGFIASSMEMIQQLTDVKLLSGLTTSEVNERMVYQMLSAGSYRKYMSRLQQRLQQQMQVVTREFEEMGLTLELQPQAGMFVWAKMPEGIDPVILSQKAAGQGMMLAPGSLFRPHQQPSNYMRFNVAWCDKPEFWEHLKRLMD